MPRITIEFGGLCLLHISDKKQKITGFAIHPDASSKHAAEHRTWIVLPKPKDWKVVEGDAGDWANGYLRLEKGATIKLPKSDSEKHTINTQDRIRLELVVGKSAFDPYDADTEKLIGVTVELSGGTLLSASGAIQGAHPLSAVIWNYEPMPKNPVVGFRVSHKLAHTIETPEDSTESYVTISTNSSEYRLKPQKDAMMYLYNYPGPSKLTDLSKVRHFPHYFSLFKPPLNKIQLVGKKPGIVEGGAENYEAIWSDYSGDQQTEHYEDIWSGDESDKKEGKKKKKGLEDGAIKKNAICPPATFEN